MSKLRLLILLSVFLLTGIISRSQQFPAPQSSFRSGSPQSFALHIRGVDRDSAFVRSTGIPYAFGNRNECVYFLNQLPATLRTKGYVTASLDSIHFDSASASIVVYLGDRYEWETLNTDYIDPVVLEAVGYRDQSFQGKPFDYASVKDYQDKILAWFENHGHPFAKVFIDSLTLNKDKIRAKLSVEEGPAYTIDSIHVLGSAKISNEFLQRYLDLRNGETFSREKLLLINKRMRELTYVEEEFPARLVWLNSGSFLEMYLKQKKSSQVNVLVGFLPNSDASSSKKLLVTGEANLNLKNALGAGETIGLNWQQLQQKSPRLNISYQHPYLFHSPFGLDFSFDMFRKDSTFLNVNYQLGVQYRVDNKRSGKVFIQRAQTIVNGANTAYVLANYKLPDEADVSAVNLGIDYEYNSTNYRLNPTSGSEFRVITSIGTKQIHKNAQIVELHDSGNPNFDFNSLYDTLKLKSYQFRFRGTGAHYFPLGGLNRATVKASLNAGFVQSANLFRNELFQIGGYKLLRGFDEESEYLSQFLVGTLEYRFLVGQNSFFYGFSDGGWGRNNSQNFTGGNAITHTYISGGLGLSFESKVGIFNIAWAVGKRNDLPFNLRQSKIHFGFVNYF